MYNFIAEGKLSSIGTQFSSAQLVFNYEKTANRIEGRLLFEKPESFKNLEGNTFGIMFK